MTKEIKEKGKERERGVGERNRFLPRLEGSVKLAAKTGLRGRTIQ